MQHLDKLDRIFKQYARPLMVTPHTGEAPVQYLVLRNQTLFVKTNEVNPKFSPTLRTNKFRGGLTPGFSIPVAIEGRDGKVEAIIHHQKELPNCEVSNVYVVMQDPVYVGDLKDRVFPELRSAFAVLAPTMPCAFGKEEIVVYCPTIIARPVSEYSGGVSGKTGSGNTERLIDIMGKLIDNDCDVEIQYWTTSEAKAQAVKERLYKMVFTGSQFSSGFIYTDWMNKRLSTLLKNIYIRVIQASDTVEQAKTRSGFESGVHYLIDEADQYGFTEKELSIRLEYHDATLAWAITQN